MSDQALRTKGSEGAGLELDWPKKVFRFFVSDESVKRVTLALERFGYSCLAWTERNPGQFAAVLFCVTIVALAAIAGWTLTKRQKREYVTVRENSR